MSQSNDLFQRAQQCIPGGVNSPVRAFKGVGGDPLFIKRGLGAYLVDEQEKHYIDYIGSWGALILGHAHPAVVRAVTEAVKNGLGYGAPCRFEVELAEKICDLMPSIDMIRMVNSGTEATMSAIRLARGFTQRNKIIKFEGCYHGHADALLISAGSGLATLDIQSSPGIPASVAQDTLVAPFNDLAAVKQLFETHGEEIAAIIVEPVAGNMSCILPVEGFLQGLRDVCDQYRSVLIFDEVMTGFRVSLTGAQGYYGITPDLTTLGKVIGGGMPVGAFGGRRDIMEQLAPLGSVYQAGTLSGNPIAMAAGLSTLNEISQPGFYEALETNTQALAEGLASISGAQAMNLKTTAIGGMFGCYFTDAQSTHTYKDVSACDIEQFKRFFHVMLDQGIYLAPSAFEAGFMSAAHGEEEIELTLNAAENAFRQISVSL